MTATSVHPPARPNTDAEYRRPWTSDDDWAQRLEVLVAAQRRVATPDRYLAFATTKAVYERLRRGRTTAPGGARSSTAGWSRPRWGWSGRRRGLLPASRASRRTRTRGRGLARTLVHRVSGYGFDELGARTLAMVADPDYLAIRLLRSVGFADTEVGRPSVVAESLGR